jgi:membrane-bound serine protease (ClpP class)
MKQLRIILLTLGLLAVFSSRIHAQSGRPLVVILDAEGPIMPAMQEYIERGIKIAERDDAEVLILRLNTPGGAIDTMNQITEAIRASDVPVIVYVSPRGAWAASAGAIITMSAHASAMAPETTIGAASPVGGSGEDLGETIKAKEMEALTAKARTFTAGRGEEATRLAESMILTAEAVTAEEALDVRLIDFIVDDTDALLEKLDGFTVQMADGPRVLHTADAETESLPMNFIEELLMVLTSSIIVLTLLGVGVQAILIEISSPGGWVAGFVGVVCLSLAGYGLGILPVNWFGIIFLGTAFVLFILDVKAPTHGALTAAGIASFIVGALVLFNSPGTPDFVRVSIPGVILLAALLGSTFAVIVGFGVRALRTPVRVGEESLIGKTGTAKTSVEEAGGQVQLQSELWSAELAEGAAKIRKGDTVEVVEVKGLRLKVRKK